MVPVISLLKALNDPVVNLSMGQTAEKLAFRYNISRTEMDQFAVQSQLRAAAATKNHLFKDELVPLFDWRGKCYEADTGIRADSSVEKLGQLKPVFDKPFGSVTAGNSSQISDGAALVILASKDAIQKYKLKPLARIVDVAWEALDPSVMGLGPAYSIAALLKKNKLSLKDIDYFEINEAFACQVIACIRYLEEHNLGTIDQSKLNVDGGAIAMGHPVGASGARLTLHLCHTLQRNHAKYGIATLCIGGGQGGGMLIENVMGRV
jgi:acetyl-CoA C-acetyltransferase